MTINTIEKFLNKYDSSECTGLCFCMSSGTCFVVGTTDYDLKKPESVILSKRDATILTSYRYDTAGIHNTQCIYDCGQVAYIAVYMDSGKDHEQRASITIQN